MVSVRKSDRQFYIAMSMFVLVGVMLILSMLSFSDGSFAHHRSNASLIPVISEA